MEAIDVPDWDDFELRLKELRARFLGTRSSPLLLRGQSNSEWPLTTTLERAGCEGLPFSDYYLLMTRVKPAIESSPEK